MKAILLLALLTMTPAEGSYDVGDTSWSFPEAKVKLSAKAKGAGNVKLKTTDAGELFIGADGSWTISAGGEQVTTGTWSKDGPPDKSLDMSLDANGEELLIDWLEPILEQAAEAKYQSPVTLTLYSVESTKLKVGLKVNKKQQTVRVKGSLKVVLTGLTDSAAGFDAETTAKYRLKGISAELPLSAVSP